MKIIDLVQNWQTLCPEISKDDLPSSISNLRLQAGQRGLSVEQELNKELFKFLNENASNWELDEIPHSLPT